MLWKVAVTLPFSEPQCANKREKPSRAQENMFLLLHLMSGTRKKRLNHKQGPVNFDSHFFNANSVQRRLRHPPRRSRIRPAIRLQSRKLCSSSEAPGSCLCPPGSQQTELQPGLWEVDPTTYPAVVVAGSWKGTRNLVLVGLAGRREKPPIAQRWHHWQESDICLVLSRSWVERRSIFYSGHLPESLLLVVGSSGQSPCQPLSCAKRMRAVVEFK